MRSDLRAMAMGLLGALIALAAVGATTHYSPVSTPQGAGGAFIEFAEGSGNGTNKITIEVPDSIASDIVWCLDPTTFSVGACP